jgi:hypothetical protein
MTAANRNPAVVAAVAIVLAIAVIVGAVAWLRIDSTARQGNRLPERFDYDLEKYAKIDPALIHYSETAVFPVNLVEPRAVAVGPNDQIFVAGDKSVAVFAPDGKQVKTIALNEEPHCLAISPTGQPSPGWLYVGMRDHVEVYDADGRRQAVWPQPGKRAVLTSIAVGEEDVFVADAGSLLVWHYDRKGKLIGSIGKRDPSREIPGFIVPSPYFDLAIAPDGLLRVVNPGMHRIEAFTFDGHLELSWGRSGIDVKSFCGCCNPSNIAILSDGRVVTAEKGLPRVKVYASDGRFECVVVGTTTLAPNPALLTEGCDENSLHPVDLAVDSRDRILALDPSIASIRVFERKSATMKGTEGEKKERDKQ